MKALVIAEKPSVARDIARVLGCTQKGNGFLGRKRIRGHLGAGTSGHPCRPGGLR